MPSDPKKKTVKFSFGLNGMVTKQNPTLLTDGQYRSCTNMEVVQEGSLSTRIGKKYLGSVGGGSLGCYMIQKMVVQATEDPSVPSTNPRYLGVIDATNDLVRTVNYTSYTVVATAINSGSGRQRKAFSLATYAAGEVGGPWAFIASENKMLKDSGNSPYATFPLPLWGILPAFGVATAVAVGVVGSAPNGPNGGAAGSPNGTTPYDYRYVYQAKGTNNEGNPSQTMLDDSVVTNGTPVAVQQQNITVTVWGTNDPQIGTGAGSTINIYRRGGLLYDTWRFVGFCTNPGAGLTNTFLDTAADVDLLSANFLTVDNDPPVPSSLSTRANATATIPATAAGGGRQSITIAGGSISAITPGTQVYCIFDAPETITVESVVGNVITAYFQHVQPVGTTIFADTVCGQPCNLCITYQQFVLVAGDPNNPHLIYRSKGDTPEAFTVTPADGSVATVACGSPSNPIMRMYDFRGQVTTLNLYSIFETVVFNGSFVAPARMADRGTVGMLANCKTDTEIWFLSWDGVWSWDGAQCRKRSESIDPIFHGQQINGILPIDYSQASSCTMESHRGQIHLIYQAVGGIVELICEPMFGDRWRSNTPTSTQIISFQYTELDTQSMIEAYSAPTASFLMADQYKLSGGINYTADQFTSAWVPPGSPGGAGGAVIPFDIVLPWFDLGAPASTKLFEEALLELDTTGSAGSGVSALTVVLTTDFSDTAVDTLTIAPPVAGGRTLVSLLPQLTNVSSNINTFGRECRSISFHVSGYAWPTQMTLYSLTVIYQEIDLLTAGGAADWTDLGYPHDKRLYQMVVTFDTAGVDQKIVMDTMTGIDGKTYNPAVQVFTLSNPTITGGGGRAKKTFPITDGIIAKMVRVRPYATAAVGAAATVLFKILSVEFTEKEDYPPDIVSFTPWEDGDYAFAKYLNQATLDVDTNGVAVTVQIQADGSTVSTQVVTGTGSNRDQNLTVLPSASGKKWRIYVDPSQTAIATGGGKFQLFNPGRIFRFQPADRGEVGHTFDWDDLGHPWDKYLRSVTIEWDNTGGANVSLGMDTLTGIGGQTVNTAVATFVLSGGRAKREFPLPKDTIAKMIRVYPIAAPPVTFRQWKYGFDKIDYPCDIVLSTEWKNAESPDDKNPSWLSIDADTQGIACSVNLENESGSVMTVQHTGTITDRMRNYPIPVDTFAKMWRLSATPGTNGKFQLFSWAFARWTTTSQSSPADPPDVVLWTPWNDWDWPYGSIGRNLILTMDTGGVPCQVVLQTENGSVQTFTMTSTYTTRRAIFPCNANLVGLMWRLLLTPFTTGKAKLWDWSMEVIKEPAAVTQWSSYLVNLGYKGFKIMRQIWLTYQCASPLSVTVTSDTGAYVVVLPTHAVRATERLLLPSVFGNGLNKSKNYSLSWVSASPVKVYSDNSGLEWIAQGIEQHAGYTQTTVSELMTMAI